MAVIVYLILFGVVGFFYCAAVFYSGTAVLKLAGESFTAKYRSRFWTFWALFTLGQHIIKYVTESWLLKLFADLWIAFILYFSLSILFFDAIAFIDKKCFFTGILKDQRRLILYALILTLLLLVYGAYQNLLLLQTSKNF
jgi:hypothetical protein